MKPLVSLVVVLCLIFFAVVSHTQSFVFKEAKRVALLTTPDKDGDYVLRNDKVVDGQRFVYALGYFPRSGQIGVVKLTNRSGVVIMCDESNSTYVVGVIKDGIPQNDSVKPISEEQADKVAEEVLNGIHSVGIPI